MTHSRKLVFKNIEDGLPLFGRCDPDECPDGEPLFYERDDLEGPANFEPLQPIEPNDKKAAYKFAVRVMRYYLFCRGRHRPITVEDREKQRAHTFLEGGTPDYFGSDDPLKLLDYMIEQTRDATSEQFDPASYSALWMIWNHLNESGGEIPPQLRQWMAQCPELPKRRRGFNLDRAAVQEDTDVVTQGLVEFCSLLGPVQETRLRLTRNPQTKFPTICHAVAKVMRSIGYRATYSTVRQKVEGVPHLENLRQFVDGDG